jgi:LuxR family transcriptional regulator, maltose regulon positive regulatory protein
VNDQLVRLPLSKSGELLVYLALHGPTRRDTLVNAVFGEARGSKPLEYFKVAIRRLRAALAGSVRFDPVVFERGEYRLSEAFRLEVDVDGLWQNRVEVAAANVLAWLEGFGGSFLPKVDSEWAISARQCLLDARIHAALNAARRLEDQAPLEAIQLYRWVVTLEPWMEGAYEAMGRVYARLDDRNAAQWVSDQLEQLRRRVLP